MDAEIELKLFFQLEHKDELIQLLDNIPHSQPQGCRHLINAYFDTAELQLRRWDMGLRVRDCEGVFEQTIKTRGSVIAGIHSRPEFNVDIEQNCPILALFPEKIWPEQANISSVQSELTCLFNTDFSRRTWHIYVDNSLIEVALDVGNVVVDIVSEQRTEPICELEFELMVGEVASLIKLGLLVADSLPVRLGKMSKAQRGYRLAAQASPLSLDVLEFISLKPEQDLKQALITLLSTGIDRWQSLEAMILASGSALDEQVPSLCYRLRACIRLLRCTLAQFDLLNSSLVAKFDCIEGHLDFIELSLSCVELLQPKSVWLAKLPQHKQLSELVSTQLQLLNIPLRMESMLEDLGYGSLQLALVESLFELKSGKHPFDKEVCLQEFAGEMQEASWLNVTNLVPSNIALSSADYLSFARALDESVFVGVAYGELYSAKSRDLFRMPWQDLILGIRTLAAYRLLRDLSQHNAIDISSWLTNKEQSLLFAMENSRRMALKNEPYWR